MKDHEVKQLVESGYDKIANRFLEAVQRDHAGNTSSARMVYLQKLLERLPPEAQVLELGCGAGVPCTQIIARQAHVTGVDISAKQIELARHYVPDATFLQEDMMTLTFPPDSFDAIVAFFSIIHLPRTEQAILLQRLITWLRSGGCLLVNLGASNDPGSVEPDWLGTPMYWSSYDTETNIGLIQQAGFTIVEAETLSDNEDGEPVSFLWILAKRER